MSGFQAGNKQIQQLSNRDLQPVISQEGAGIMRGGLIMWIDTFKNYKDTVKLACPPCRPVLGDRIPSVFRKV
jgi:hypothetical protein